MVATAFEGVYGAWVNTDGFTVGEQKEIYSGIRIFETAKKAQSMRHYVWSSLDYAFKVSPKVGCRIELRLKTLFPDGQLR